MHADLGDCRVREGKAESDHSGNVITATSPPCPARNAAVMFLLDRGCLNLMMDIKNEILINYLILAWIYLPSLTKTEMCM